MQMQTLTRDRHHPPPPCFASVSPPSRCRRCGCVCLRQSRPYAFVARQSSVMRRLDGLDIGGGALLVAAIAPRPPSPVHTMYTVPLYVPLPPSTPFGPGGRVCRCRTSGGASEKSGRQVNNNNNTNLPCGLTSKSSRCSKQQQPPPETGTEKKAGQFWTAAAHGSLWSSSHRVTLQALGLDDGPACAGRAGRRWDGLPSLEPPCLPCLRARRAK